MKKIIVMLLVLAVFVGGVFAVVVHNDGTGKFEKAFNGTALSAEDKATMTMYYQPPQGLIYAVFGFSDDAVSENENGHLNIVENTAIGKKVLENNVTAQSVTASATFNIFYEIMVQGNTGLKLVLNFDSEFVDNAVGGDGGSFKYKKEIGSSTQKNSLDEETTTADIVTITPTTTSEGLYTGNIPVSVSTGDLSGIKLGRDYAAGVTLTIASV